MAREGLMDDTGYHGFDECAEFESCTKQAYEQGRADSRNENPYWHNICQIADRQRAKGIETYGTGIEENNQDINTRLEYLQEELVDALMYCEWIKEKINAESTNA